MASAILPRRNEPRWGECMSKFTSSSNLNFTRFEDITSPNPSHFFIGNPSRDVFWKNQQLPSSAPPEASYTGSSINSIPENSYGHRYITFRLGSYTKRELKELKKRLISDLERVRILRHWICSTPIPKKDCHPQQLELLTTPQVDLTGKENQKSAVGKKRTKPFPFVRDTKKQYGRVKNNAQRSKVGMRKCGQILAKLMKHRHGWVFNTPVDAAALKLYDYHSIIKNPMDLGTIKTKLVKNEYESPLAFASDVRLTFQNAMVYNGKGSDVFVMAERLLSLFEDMFNPTHQKFVGKQVKKQNCAAKVPILVENLVSNEAVVLEQVSKSVVPEEAVLPGSMNAADLGEPMARDANNQNKPEMTVQQKSELAASLLNLQLGHDGMDQIIGIMKKGFLGLEHEGDEIELDLGVIDNETLWELHSFIGSSSRKAAGNSKAEGIVSNLGSYVQTNNSPGSEPLVQEQGRKRDIGEEDIDIGEEIPITNIPPVEIEKDAVNVSGSSSSGSSSGSASSSSGSGSDGSSGDDTEKGRNGCNEHKANSTPKGGSMGF